MTTARTVSVPRRPVDPEKLGYFRFGRLGSGVIVTNEHGEWHHFDEASFRSFLAGEIDESHPEFGALSAKGLLRPLDPEHLAGCLRRRKRHVGLGPAVHVVPLARDGERLGVDRAKDILDFAMLSTSSALELRLLAGDAPVDLDLLGFLVQYANEKNRYEGKGLSWRLDIDPARLGDEAVAFVIDKRFRVRAPLSAPAFGDETLARIAALHEVAAARKREGWAVEVEVRADATLVEQLPAVADHLAAHGIRRFRVVPVHTGDAAVPPAAWAAGYRALLAHLLAPDGAPVEETAAAVVTAASRTEGSADVTLRSPFAGSLVAYDLQGRILPSVAALDVDEPDMFSLGTVGHTPYKEVTAHDTLRALTVASLLECLPGFADHWATPYLGVDPVASFAATGDLFAKAPTSLNARALLAVVEAVFETLVAHDTPAATRLTAWIE